jgi:hypothetical protein
VLDVTAAERAFLVAYVVLAALLYSSPTLRLAHAVTEVPPAPDLTRQRRREITVTRTSTTTPTTELEPLDDPTVGDVLNVPEDPILDPAAVTHHFDVIVNIRLAKERDGDHAIMIPHFPKDGRITAGSAKLLMADLETASQLVADIRGPLGYDT